MGIINTTPDSFSDGGVHYDPTVAINAGVEMFRQGADIVDVGGESTRPGSSFTDETEELRRTTPVIRGIMERVPHGVISIDTRRRRVAEAAIDAGAQIVNDISGFRDEPDMVDLVRETGAAAVIMHMAGMPKTMQQEIRYHDFPGDVHRFLGDRSKVLEDAGVDPERIIIDPGVGFGKTFDHNLILINRLHVFKDLGKPVLLGASRKSFLGKILDQPVAGERLMGSVAVAVAGLLKGADILRVHDVEETVQACKVAEAIIRERVSA
ncbi:MAG: dihydropteroate synthase [Pseudomonadota bacterium]